MRVVLISKYPEHRVVRSFPRTGFHDDPLPVLGEEVEVVACDRPGKTFTAVVISVDPKFHSYCAKIYPDSTWTG